MTRQTRFFSVFTVLVASVASLAAVNSERNSAFAQDISDNVQDAIGDSVSSDFFRPGLTVRNQVTDLRGVFLSSDRRSLVTLVSGRSIHLWNMMSGVRIAAADLPGEITSVEPLSSFGGVAVGMSSGDIVLAFSGAAVPLSKRAHTGALKSLASSKDGARIYSAGADGKVIAWNSASMSGAAPLAFAPANTSALACNTDCSFLIAGTSSGEIYKLDMKSSTADKIGQVGNQPIQRTAVSSDGSSFAALGTSGDVGTGSIAAKTVSVKKISGTKFELDRNARQVVAFGSGTDISLIDIASGSTLGNLTAQITMGPKPGPVNAAALDSQASRLFTTAEGGVMRMWDTQSRRDLIQVYHTQAGWAVVDQNGRFDAGEAAFADVGWTAKGQEVSLEQTTDSYYTPGLMSDYFDGKEPSIQSQAPSLIQRGMKLPPKVEIDVKEATSGSPAHLVAIAQDQGGGIGQLRMYHNGKLMPPGALMQQQELTKGGRIVRGAAFQITPTPGLNTFFAVAQSNPVSTQGQVIEGSSQRITKSYPLGAQKPRLHLLAVGINQYANSGMTLSYAVNDATSIAGAVKAGAARHFQSVESKILLDAAANRSAVMAALADFQKAGPEDVIAIYLAGHGELSGDDWNFLPQEVSFGGKGISARDLTDALIKAPAQRAIIMLDSCNSGRGADVFRKFQKFQRRFVLQLSRNAGITVLAGAKADAGAAEVRQLSHGLFTYAILDGLKGKADSSPQDGLTSAHEIVRFASKEVPNLSSRLKMTDLQQPAYFAIGADFPMK